MALATSGPGACPPMARRRRPREPGEPRGTVHPLLDLHGLTGDEALRRAEGWLRARAAEGERTVVIVTGRGRHSSGLPVLRPEIEHLLEGLRGSTVAEWEPTHGSGGFRVSLRPPAALPGAAAAAETLARQYPPELRRRRIARRAGGHPHPRPPPRRDPAHRRRRRSRAAKLAFPRPAPQPNRSLRPPRGSWWPRIAELRARPRPPNRMAHTESTESAESFSVDSADSV